MTEIDWTDHRKKYNTTEDIYPKNKWLSHNSKSAVILEEKQDPIINSQKI
jgi:hypothetical protein